jgi:hypothetical protein
MAWLQIILALGMLTTGCAEHVLTQWPQKQTWSTYLRLNEVRRGMSLSEVEGLMGPPGIREEGDYRGGHYIFYFYLTHNMDYEDGDTVRGGYTPLVFKNNQLVGIGRRDYRSAVDRAADGRWPGMPWNRTQ